MKERRYVSTVLVMIACLCAAVPVAARAEELTPDPTAANDRRPFPYIEERLRDQIIRRRASRNDTPSAEVAPEKPPERHSRWNRALPFLAQRVLDMGYELPKPYGFGVAYATVEQDHDLSDLNIRLGDGEVMDIDFISFGDTDSDSDAYQLRLDAWILPFVNVYALLGAVEGDSVVPFSVPADDALDILLPPIGALCDAAPALRPEICDQQLNAVVHADFEGDSWGLGTVIAGGWRDYFVSVNLTYVVTDIEDIETDSTSWDTSARIGYLGESGIIDYAIFVGVNHLKADTNVVGTASYDLTGVDPVDRVLTVDYEIFQGNSEATNYFFGVNLDVSRSWHLTGQYGTGGSRDQLVLSLSRRL